MSLIRDMLTHRREVIILRRQTERLAAFLAAAEEERDRLRVRVEDFEDDFRKVTSETCAPDERHCSCVPYLRREIARLRAGGCARNQRTTQYCAEAADRETTIKALRAEIEEARTSRAVVDRLNAEAFAAIEELRLALAAEHGKPEGAPSAGWEPPNICWPWVKRHADGVEDNQRAAMIAADKAMETPDAS